MAILDAKYDFWEHHRLRDISLKYSCRKRILSIDRIRLPESTASRTYELWWIAHVTPFRKYGKHSTEPSTYGPLVQTYGKLFSCKSVLTVCSYRAQSNEICTYGRVSRGSLQKVCRYGFLYLRTVEYDQSVCVFQLSYLGAFVSAVCLCNQHTTILYIVCIVPWVLRELSKAQVSAQ